MSDQAQSSNGDATSATTKSSPPVASRAVLQQCLSAKLQLNHPDNALVVEDEPVFATIGKGSW